MERSVAELSAIADITALKYRYARSLDNKLWDEFGDTLTEDVAARYGTATQGEPLHFDSRAAVVEYMSGALSTNIITVHTFSHPEIAVTGNEASGSWSMSDVVIVPEFDTMITGTSYYTDRYRRDDDGWRISHTEYFRLYEATQPMSPNNFTLIANRWAPLPTSPDAH